MMIDREARDQLALALRRLAAGRITNDEFDETAFWEYSCRDDDRALDELAVFGWLHYSDFSTYRLRGRRALSREGRRQLARAVLFLKTDQAYVFGNNLVSCTCLRWGCLCAMLAVAALSLVAGAISYLASGSFLLGLTAVLLPAYIGYWIVHLAAGSMGSRRWERAALSDTFWPFADRRASMAAFRFWPFASRESYEAALRVPPFLVGR